MIEVLLSRLFHSFYLPSLLLILMTPFLLSYFFSLFMFLVFFRASSWELNRHHLRNLNASWSPLALTVCLLMTTLTHSLQMNTFNRKLYRKSRKSD